MVLGLGPGRIAGSDFVRRHYAFGEKLIFYPRFYATRAAHLAGRSDNRKPLWTLLVFQMWQERYLNGAEADGISGLDALESTEALAERAVR